jgi:hypothetical protein
VNARPISSTTFDSLRGCDAWPMSSAIHDALAALTRAFRRADVGWYLFGAQAALLRGSRRLTSDIDVTVLPGDVSTSTLLDELAAQGISLRVADADDFVKRTRVLPLVHDASGMPVDVVIGGPGLEQLFLDAAEPVSLDDLVVPVASAAHLVVMKLLAGRPKDLDDAEAMVRAATMDLDEIEPLVEAIAEGLGEDDIRRALASVRRRTSGSSNPPSPG